MSVTVIKDGEVQSIKDGSAHSTAEMTVHDSAVDAHGRTENVLPVDQLPTKASDTLRHSNDAEKSTSGETEYTKIKEMKLNASLNACRIKFDLKCNQVATMAGAMVYKNGVGIGTAQMTEGTTYETKSEDFTDFKNGDLIQIYARQVGGDNALVRNMRIYYDLADTKTAPTNQDP